MSISKLISGNNINNGAAFNGPDDRRSYTGYARVMTDLDYQSEQTEHRFSDRYAHPHLPIIGISGDVVVGASGAETTWGAAAESGVGHVMGSFTCSYSDTPTHGRVLLRDGTDTIFTTGITDKGPKTFDFDPPKKGSINKVMSVVLTAGGVGITGIISIGEHWFE